jgi:signal peptidase I
MFDAYKVPSGSMMPTLEPGDRVLAWSVGGRDP